MAIRHRFGIFEIIGMFRIIRIIGIFSKIPKILTILIFSLFLNFALYLNDLAAIIKTAKLAGMMR